MKRPIGMILRPTMKYLTFDGLLERRMLKIGREITQLVEKAIHLPKRILGFYLMGLGFVKLAIRNIRGNI